MDVAIHPLAIINISDHCTRTRLAKSNERSVGILMGRQEAKKVSVLDSVELKIVDRAIDRAQFTASLELYKAVYPASELMGWYSAGAPLHDDDKLLHKQFQEFNESPLFLVLDPDAKQAMGDDKKELPVTLYELRLTVVAERSETNFFPLPFMIETIEPERVAVDHMARGVPAMGRGSTSSTLTAPLGSLYNAVSMLKGRVQLLRKFIEATRTGAVPLDRALLREAVSLCLQTDALKADLGRDHLDEAKLVTYLSVVAKETAAVNGVLEKFFIAHPPGIEGHMHDKPERSGGAGTGAGGKTKGMM